jgi:hypothetical protein
VRVGHGNQAAGERRRDRDAGVRGWAAHLLRIGAEDDEHADERAQQR